MTRQGLLKLAYTAGVANALADADIKTAGWWDTLRTVGREGLSLMGMSKPTQFVQTLAKPLSFLGKDVAPKVLTSALSSGTTGAIFAPKGQRGRAFLRGATGGALGALGSYYGARGANAGLAKLVGSGPIAGTGFGTAMQQAMAPNKTKLWDALKGAKGWGERAILLGTRALATGVPMVGGMLGARAGKMVAGAMPWSKMQSPPPVPFPIGATAQYPMQQGYPGYPSYPGYPGYPMYPQREM